LGKNCTTNQAGLRGRFRPVLSEFLGLKQPETRLIEQNANRAISKEPLPAPIESPTRINRSKNNQKYNRKIKRWQNLTYFCVQTVKLVLLQVRELDIQLVYFEFIILKV
jgi:hypothetical protein